MKRIMLLLISLVIILCADAQQTEKKIPSINESKLVKQITELLNHAKTNFVSIKGAPDKELNKKYEAADGTYYKTRLQPDGAVETYLQKRENSTQLEYRSYFYQDASSYSPGPGKLFEKIEALITENFKEEEFEIAKDYGKFLGDDYKELTLKGKGDSAHYLLLKLSEFDNTEEILIDLYIAVY